MARSNALGMATLLLASACLWHGTPVPVAGDFSRFGGEWDGTYSSIETGRSGSIIFQLIAGTDSAYGDVLMTPVQGQGMVAPQDQRRAGAAVPAPHALRIAFVHSQGERVAGTLENYPDPVTGEMLHTRFEGRLRGDEITGTYTTLAATSGRLLTGEWSVKRKKM